MQNLRNLDTTEKFPSRILLSFWKSIENMAYKKRLRSEGGIAATDSTARRKETNTAPVVL
ncbi:hypothetical protein BOTCAL_0030g00290 [Botryotinia calthae]|uniref:Uncharacterized protein n=1 Tax=Botryotinia calthae TaxID=38488 RepID=A0A4Y8DDN6_9HELO|nr:hypothetical protein BOTCAL_0030g00290 [Botryotinia calthae]